MTIARKVIGVAIMAMLIGLPRVANNISEPAILEEKVEIKSVEVSKPLTERERLEQLASRGEIRVINMEITAYCTGSITSTGIKPRRGIVAVDPDVIPYHSKLYIEGIGEVLAEDCGGAIEGNQLDMYVTSYDEAINWGRQIRKVYVIRSGGDAI